MLRRATASPTGPARRGTARALRLYHELLPDQERVLGPDHPETLTTRHEIARWTGEAGDAPRALRLYRELLPDRQRVQGPDHPETLTMCHHIAHWTGEAGDARERCDYAASCSRTGSASSDLITPTRWGRATASPTGPARLFVGPAGRGMCASAAAVP